MNIKLKKQERKRTENVKELKNLFKNEDNLYTITDFIPTKSLL